jgi:hypothetical protein
MRPAPEAESDAAIKFGFLPTVLDPGQAFVLNIRFKRVFEISANF